MAGYPGWTRRSPPGDKLAAHWEHLRSGWSVRHCGHPTANYPYTAFSPDGYQAVAPNGRGFTTLQRAMAAVEQLHSRQRILIERPNIPAIIASWSDARELLLYHDLDDDQVAAILGQVRGEDW